MGKIIYEERLFSKWITLLLGVVTAIMLGLTMRQWLTVLPTARTEWFNPVFFLFFLALTMNFARLTVVITDERATIGYGVIRHHVRWQDIEDCYPDEASVARYGGWGIRLGWYEGKRRLVYNVMGAPRVVLLRRNSSFPELVFSTGNPQEVVEKVRAELRKAAR